MNNKCEKVKTLGTFHGFVSVFVWSEARTTFKILGEITLVFKVELVRNFGSGKVGMF